MTVGSHVDSVLTIDPGSFSAFRLPLFALVGHLFSTRTCTTATSSRPFPCCWQGLDHVALGIAGAGGSLPRVISHLCRICLTARSQASRTSSGSSSSGARVWPTLEKCRTSAALRLSVDTGITGIRNWMVVTVTAASARRRCVRCALQLLASGWQSSASLCFCCRWMLSSCTATSTWDPWLQIRLIRLNPLDYRMARSAVQRCAVPSRHHAADRPMLDDHHWRQAPDVDLCSWLCLRA